MEISSKQRAFLRSLAQKEEPLFQIGKDGVTPEVTQAVEEAFHNRELMKLSVNKNCFTDIREVLQTLAERTHAVPVESIGRKIVLYRQDKDNPQIVLPR